MSGCTEKGCRHLETKCKDCGRLVIDRILPITQEWISVKDKLPDSKGPFLVCVISFGTSAYKEGEVYLDVDKFLFCGTLKFSLECRGYGEVTHWMQLSEPPQE